MQYKIAATNNIDNIFIKGIKENRRNEKEHCEW